MITLDLPESPKITIKRQQDKPLVRLARTVRRCGHRICYVSDEIHGDPCSNNFSLFVEKPFPPALPRAGWFGLREPPKPKRVEWCLFRIDHFADPFCPKELQAHVCGGEAELAEVQRLIELAVIDIPVVLTLTDSSVGSPLKFWLPTSVGVELS